MINDQAIEQALATEEGWAVLQDFFAERLVGFKLTRTKNRLVIARRGAFKPVHFRAKFEPSRDQGYYGVQLRAMCDREWTWQRFKRAGQALKYLKLVDRLQKGILSNKDFRAQNRIVQNGSGYHYDPVLITETLSCVTCKRCLKKIKANGHIEEAPEEKLVDHV